MNLDNTKIYTTDPEVIRKYAELCGKSPIKSGANPAGYYNGGSQNSIYSFAANGFVSRNSMTFATIYPDQINALYDEKFGKVETPEEAEAFDIMAHDSQMLKLSELVKHNPVIDVDGKLYTADDVRALLSLQDVKVEWSGEGLPPIGVECEVCFNGEWHRFIPRSYHKKPDTDECVLGDMLEHGSHEWEAGYCSLDFDFRKPETPQQREERERLEAAYDLYLEHNKMNNWAGVSMSEFNSKIPKRKRSWLTIVDKTGYRKQKDGE